MMVAQKNEYKDLRPKFLGNKSKMNNEVDSEDTYS